MEVAGSNGASRKIGASRRTANGTCGVSDPKLDARVLVIDTYEDLERVVERWPDSDELRLRFPAWHQIASEFDAVHVSDEGQSRTRLTAPLNLYGWDCETTLWLRWAFRKVSAIGPRNFPVKNDDC